jgi:hypothetical protein
MFNDAYGEISHFSNSLFRVRLTDQARHTVLFGRPKSFSFRSRCSASTTRSEREDQLSLIRRNATVNTASERPKNGPRQIPFNSPAARPHSCLRRHTGRDGYPKRVVSSAANTTWYLGSSRTDFANPGSGIPLLMPAIVALAASLDCLLFFLISHTDTSPVLNLSAIAQVGDVRRSGPATRRCEQYLTEFRTQRNILTSDNPSDPLPYTNEIHERGSMCLLVQSHTFLSSMVNPSLRPVSPPYCG